MNPFRKKIVKDDDQELVAAMLRFVGAFQIVFQHDWDYTLIMIGDEEEGPTFLAPGLEDESEDWGARGALLEAHRHLLKVMKERGLEPDFPIPIANFLGVKK